METLDLHNAELGGGPAGGDTGMAAEGNGVPTVGAVQCVEQGGGVAVDRFSAKDLPGEYDTGVELLVESGEIGEDGGEDSEKHTRSWWRRSWGGGGGEE